MQGIRGVISTLTNDGQEVMGPGVLVWHRMIAMSRPSLPSGSSSVCRRSGWCDPGPFHFLPGFTGPGTCASPTPSIAAPRRVGSHMTQCDITVFRCTRGAQNHRSGARSAAVPIRKCKIRSNTGAKSP
jgi:hypothetical protein